MRCVPYFKKRQPPAEFQPAKQSPSTHVCVEHCSHCWLEADGGVELVEQHTHSVSILTQHLLSNQGRLEGTRGEGRGCDAAA